VQQCGSSKTNEGARTLCQENRDRQAAKLRGGEKSSHAYFNALPRSLCQYFAPKYYINIREHRSGIFEVSNPPVMHNGSFRFTVKSIIFFVWVGIYLALRTIDF
jgi:hypothetical protein